MSAVDWSTKNKIKKLIREWMRFHDFVSLHLGKEGVMVAQEKEFLNTKAKIADLLPVIGAVEGGGALSAEGAQASRGMMELMNRCPSLTRTTPLADAERSEMLREWHNYYLFLNKLSGAAEMGIRSRIASPLGAPSGTPMSGMPVGRVGGGGGGSGFLRFLIQVAILGIVVLFFLNYFGITGAELKGAAQTGVENMQEGADRVKSGLKPEPGIEKYFPKTDLGGKEKPAASEKKSSGGAGAGAEAGEPAPSASPIRAPVSAVNTFVHRISGRYPIEVTIALIGALLLGFGYLIFVRGR
jgi:hypothetical protein